VFEPSPKTKVLVVEDDPVITDMLQELLLGAGYQVECAANVIAALAVLERHAIDLITLDIELGTYSGSGLLALLKTDPHTRRIPVIVVSSAQLSPGVRRLADRVLSKPFSIGPFLQAIDSSLRHQKVATDRWHEATPDENLGLEVAREVLE
jgi:two-component system, OmpR family, KDP operon response regulator KdpE